MKISFSAKCSDCFDMTIWNDNGQSVANSEGRVPNFLGQWGDYVRLEIDMETGKVCNFEQMKKEFDKWLKNKLEEQAEKAEGEQ